MNLSPPSEPHEEPPIAGVDRQNPATARTEEEGGAGDWSNLTSGPHGPTVSDPRASHTGISEDVKPEYAFDVFSLRIVFLFLFY